MQISKRVIESATVLALALAMVITAVTSNGVYAVSDTQTAENTQLEENGLAGFAVAMNEYEVESADYLDSLISVEKEASNMVAASAEGETDVDIETVDVEAADATETTLSAEEQEWQDKLMADVKDFLYVRAKADADSDIVGKETAL